MEKIQTAIAKARAAREKQALDRAQADPDAAPRAVTPGERARQAASARAPLLETTPEGVDPAAAAAAAEGAAEAARTPSPRDRQLVKRETAVEAAWKGLATFVPDAGHLARHRVLASSGDAAAAPMDLLRTKVLQQMRTRGWRRLAVTAPSASCGASTVALNLAFSLARQSSLRVLVAEIDLRRPNLARTLQVRDRHQFSQVLAGEADLQDHALRPRPNLAVASNHAAVRNPAELLQGTTVGPALQEIEERFAPDVIIFDMPPMLSNDDTIGFMGHVDCALLVAGAGSSTLRQIDVCEQDLAAQSNVLGVVLNKCRFME